jgi:hypothetical protein
VTVDHEEKLLGEALPAFEGELARLKLEVERAVEVIESVGGVAAPGPP